MIPASTEGRRQQHTKAVDTVTASNEVILLTDSSWRARFTEWTGLDRAIALTVLARFWSAFAGVVTVLMIARFLTPHEQGYYYTFFSLFWLQIVFELGFAFVVLQLAAHERAQLTFTRGGLIEGDPTAHSRLASILQKSVRWYSVAAIVMVATLLPVGLYFFGTYRTTGTSVEWKGPWCLLILVAALTFQMDPVCAFVEGCGFVTPIARMRLLQAPLGSVLAWTAMVMHHGLYSPAMLILGNAIVQIGFLSRPRLRRMLTSLLRRAVGGNSVGWRQEIWPFQWRIAATWISSYLIFQIFNPILFAYQGPIAAGRMGMSLSIASSIGSVGLAWMSTKASPFGAMIARKEIATLDALFFRTLWQSTALVAMAAAGFFLCLVIGSSTFPKLAMRMLPPWAFSLLLLTMVMNHVVTCEALYMRAHKREPLLVQAVVVAIFLSTCTLYLARVWGANGVTVGYFLFGGALSFAWGTYIFVSKRREWYGCSTSLGAVLPRGTLGE